MHTNKGLTHIRLLASLLIAGLAIATGGANAAVGLVADDRRVTTFSDSGSNEFTPAAAFDPFSVTGQNTTVSTTAFAGTGSGYGESDFFFFIRESYFDVTFSVDDPVLIDLAGDYEAGAGDFGYAEVRVRLYSGVVRNGASLVYAATLASDFEPVFDVFAYAGSLNSGIYRLVLETSITPGGFDTIGIYNFTASFTDDPSGDADGDGVADGADNCTSAANPLQVDADGDGIGNRCDADLNNNCAVNAEDLGLLKLAFFSTDAVADFNVDGVVNALDLGLMKLAFFGTPGPSGIANICAPLR